MADLRKCPECGVSIKVENLPSHYAKLHPRTRLPTELAVEAGRAAKVQRPRPAPVVTRRGVRLIAAVSILVAVVLFLIVVNPFRGAGPNVGQQAPDFTLSTSMGGTVTLSAFRGTPVLLEFMDVDCPPCQTEAGTVLSSLYGNYSGRIRFLSVDVSFVGATDTDARINDFRTRYNTPWEYALDGSRSVQGAYGVRSTPTTFIVDRNGVILQILHGSQPTGYSAYAAALDVALGI